MRVNITWNDYLRDIDVLLNRIRSSHLSVTAVHGQEPNGLVPALILSNQMNLQLLNTLQLTSELHRSGLSRGGASHILVVDSVIGLGSDFVQFEHYGCVTASVYKRRGVLPMVPLNLYACEVDATWVVLPYEHDNTFKPSGA
jgi:hypothetical protein